MLNADKYDSGFMLLENSRELKKITVIEEEILLLKSKLLIAGKKYDAAAKLAVSGANKKIFQFFLPEIFYKAGYLKNNEFIEKTPNKIFNTLIESLYYFEKQNFEKSIEKSELYLNNQYCEDWLKIRIHLLNAYSHYNLKRYDAALTELKKVNNIQDSEVKQFEMKILCFKIQIYLNTNRFEEVDGHLTKLKNEFSSVISAAQIDYNKALLNYKKTDYKKTLTILSELLKNKNDKEITFRSILLIGETYFNLGEYEKSLTFYNSLTSQTEDDAYISLKKSSCLFYLNKSSEALKYVENKTKSNNEKLDFLRRYLLIKIQIQQGFYSAAIATGNQLKESKMFDYYPEIRLALAYCYVLTKKFKDSERELNQFSKQYNESLLKNTAKKIHAELYLASNEHEKFDQLFNDHIRESGEKGEDSEYFYYKKIYSLYLSGNIPDFEKKAMRYEELFFSGENIDKVRYMRALLALKNNNFRFAELPLSKISVSFIEYRKVVELLYKCYISLKRYNDAYSVLVKNKELLADKYNDYVSSFLNDRLTAGDDITAIEKDNIFIRTAAPSLLNSRKIAGLRLIIAEAYATQPADSISAYIMYINAALKYLEFDYDNSQKLLLNILKKFNDKNEYYQKSLLLLSELYYKTNDYENYKKYFDKIAKKNQDAAINSAVKKAEELIKKKRYYQALKIIETNNIDDINILYIKFICNYKIKPENAKTYLNAIIEKDADNVLTRKAVYFYARYLKNIKKYEEASKILEQFKPAPGFESANILLLYSIFKSMSNTNGEKRVIELIESSQYVDQILKNHIISKGD